MGESGSGLSGSVEYSTALFDAGTAGRLAGHLGVLLAGVAGDAGGRVGEVPLLSAGERDLVVRGWNETAVAVPAVGGWMS